MIDATIERQLHQEMVRLTPEQQHQVLHYARSLPYDGPLGVPGTALLGLIGIIPPRICKRWPTRSRSTASE